MEEKKGMFEKVLGFAAGVIKLPFKGIGWALDKVEKIPVLGKVATGAKLITTPLGNLGSKALDGIASVIGKPVDFLWNNVIENVPLVGSAAKGLHGIVDSVGTLGGAAWHEISHIPENWNILMGKLENRPFVSGLQRMLGQLSNVLIKMVQTILESLQNNAMKVGEAVQEAEKASVTAVVARTEADRSDGIMGFVKDKQADLAESRADKAMQNVEKVVEEGKEQMAKDFGSFAPTNDIRRDISEVLANGSAKVAEAGKIAAEKGIDISGTVEQMMPGAVPGR